MSDFVNLVFIRRILHFSEYLIRYLIASTYMTRCYSKRIILDLLLTSLWSGFSCKMSFTDELTGLIDMLSHLSKVTQFICGEQGKWNQALPGVCAFVLFRCFIEEYTLAMIWSKLYLFFFIPYLLLPKRYSHMLKTI